MLVYNPEIAGTSLSTPAVLDKKQSHSLTCCFGRTWFHGLFTCSLLMVCFAAFLPVWQQQELGKAKMPVI